MFKIEAIIQPFKLEAVKEALKEIHIDGITVTEARGCGRQRGHKEVYRGREYDVDLLPKVKLEMVVPATRKDEVVQALIQAARTGSIGDGKIFIKHYPVMNGKRVFKHAVTRMPAAIMEGMVTNSLKLSDIDMMIPHQANLRINQMVGQMIGLAPEKMHNNIQRYGNTTAASIPICMHEAIELGKIQPGQMVCLVAFGAGLTWGSVFLRY